VTAFRVEVYDLEDREGDNGVFAEVEQLATVAGGPTAQAALDEVIKEVRKEGCLKYPGEMLGFKMAGYSVPERGAGTLVGVEWFVARVVAGGWVQTARTEALRA
jgi:hypothetical protein